MHFPDQIPQDLPPGLQPAYADGVVLPEKRDPVWSLWDVLAIAVVAVGAVIVSQVLVLVVAHQLPQLRHARISELASNALILVPAQVVAYLLVIGFMVTLLWQKYRVGFLKAIRWNTPSPGTAAATLAAGGGLGLLLLIFEGLMQRWVPKSLPIEQMFQNTASVYMLAAFGILVAPVVEEIFFRGFLYPALARKTGSVVAIILTGGAFALIHQGQLAHAWVPLLGLFCVGVVFTVVRAATKSVAMTVLLHMGYNSTIFVLIFIGTHGFRKLPPH